MRHNQFWIGISSRRHWVRMASWAAVPGEIYCVLWPWCCGCSAFKRPQYSLPVLTHMCGCMFSSWLLTLQWRHNGHEGVSNQQLHHCFLKRLVRRRSKKTSKLRVTGLCEGNWPGTGEFPVEMASNADNVSIWWGHHENRNFIEDPLHIIWQLLQWSSTTGFYCLPPKHYGVVTRQLLKKYCLFYCNSIPGSLIAT